KPPPTAGRVDEFSDRLSPMVVKELRQGLRSKVFVTLFLVMQGLLCVVLLFTLAANRPDSAGPIISRTIFLLFGLSVLVAQPLRGIGAIHQEIKGDTIDLMVLTRLGSWGIVLGK